MSPALTVGPTGPIEKPEPRDATASGVAVVLMQERRPGEAGRGSLEAGRAHVPRTDEGRPEGQARQVEPAGEAGGREYVTAEFLNFQNSETTLEQDERDYLLVGDRPLLSPEETI